MLIVCTGNHNHNSLTIVNHLVFGFKWNILLIMSIPKSVSFQAVRPPIEGIFCQEKRARLFTRVMSPNDRSG